MTHRTQIITGATCIGIAALALSGGCGQANTEPLEVTYYYLPG